MPSKKFDPDNLSQDENWEVNNASFKCPIVSTLPDFLFLHRLSENYC